MFSDLKFNLSILNLGNDVYIETHKTHNMT